jgi:hypothetical protein
VVSTARNSAGQKVAVVPEYRMVPAVSTEGVPELTVKVVAPTVAGFIGSLKVTVMLVLRDTSVAPLLGV